MLIYRLYGHYSFNSRDGGEPVELVLSKGYSIGQWIDGTRMIVGENVAVSVETALHNGFARIVG